MIKLTDILCELGDLTNIDSYPYTKINNYKYVFTFMLNEKKIKAKVEFDSIGSNWEQALALLKPFSPQDEEYFKNQMSEINKKYSYKTNFSQFVSVAYTLNNNSSQLFKTDLVNFFPILKTVKNIILEYIKENKPFVIYVFGDKKTGEKGVDSQKNMLYASLSKDNSEYKSMRAADLSPWDYGSEDGILLVKKDI